MSLVNCISVSAYEGLLEANDSGSTTQAYIALKNQSFYAVVTAGRPEFFAGCSVKLSLRYYDERTRAVSTDNVIFVNTFPLEFKTRASASGSEIEVENIIHALSSQHKGALFCIVIEVTDKNNHVHVATTAPIKVVSKTDSLSLSVPTAEGSRRTITELLGEGLNKVEFNEVRNTKLLATMCKIKGLAESKPAPEGRDLNTLVKTLCEEYRTIPKGQKHHRIMCEVASLSDEDADLLNKVNQAFGNSFQNVYQQTSFR